MRWRLTFRASCLSLLLAAHGQGGMALQPCSRQAERSFVVGDVTEVSDRTPPCRIEFRETGVRLETVADGSRPDPGLNVLMDSDGRFVSANAPGWNSVISIWDSRGRYVSSLGREGEGPGELSSRGALTLLIDSSNNLHVRDGASSWSVFSPDHEFLRRVPAQLMGGLPGTTIILDDGSAVASDGLGPDAGHYFRMVDSTGALRRTFGPVNRRSTGTGGRPITYAGGQTFWAGPAEEGGDAYVLEEWGVDGELRRTLRRDVSWYRWNGNRHASPGVRYLHISQGGILYAMISRPTEDYARAWERGDMSREQRDLLTEIVVEVIDTRSGELLASEVYPASRARDILPRGLFRGSLLGYRYKQGKDDLLPFVEIIEVELAPR